MLYVAKLFVFEVSTYRASSFELYNTIHCIKSFDIFIEESLSKEHYCYELSVEYILSSRCYMHSL